MDNYMTESKLKEFIIPMKDIKERVYKEMRRFKCRTKGVAK